ncbi:MAG: type II toxin-antitoxin system VapC family toxin [Deltaproteobacteria bacterium]|nr:type II toxin-antitoxin system VapC family toxin [Deltaproteobacteria bacterium]
MICVDASLVMKWITPEEGSEIALALLRKWTKEEEELIVPSLLDYEVGTAIRQKIVRGLLHSEDLFPVFDAYSKLGLQAYHLPRLVPLAVSAAETLQQHTIYDVSYLLLAKRHEAQLVTADRRFYDAARTLFPIVRYYKDDH